MDRSSRFSLPSHWLALLAALLCCLLLTPAAFAHEPDYTSDFNRDGCTFSSTGNNPYFPLWPGYELVLEGEEEDEGEIIELQVILSILDETERVDGVETRVVVEEEREDGELVEISRNFFAHCRETGDVWYFGEDVDIYEDGEVVAHTGSFRAGEDGAEAGLQMPGTPLIGARFYQEFAPGVALDRGEVDAVDEEATVPAGTFEGVLRIFDTNELDPESEPDEKLYAPGVGLIVDEDIELVEITPPPCVNDATTLCLNNGRFQVRAGWKDFEGEEGMGQALLPSNDSGEFWFFNPENTELLVKVIDACDSEFNSFWVFAAGLTNVEVTLTVTDTESGLSQEYENDLNEDFEPVLDTRAFFTCP